MKIPEYFVDKELACRCGCKLMPNPGAVERLYALRMTIDIPMIVTSGARCIAYNDTINGAEGSKHLPLSVRPGDPIHSGAFDIKLVTDHDKYEYHLIKLAMSIGFNGIGIGTGFLHVDDARDSAPVVWTYK